MPYNFSRSLGSVIFPVRAEAAAVSGLHRYTWSSSVPDLLGKFRGIVLKLMVSEAGACPIPIHPIQPDWWNLAPALIRFAKAWLSIIFWISCLEVGLISNDT